MPGITPPVLSPSEAAAAYAAKAGPFAPTGFTGATGVSRYVGATSSGAPTTGTFAIGDFIIDRTGIVWICTVAGTPGTWVDASSSGKEIAYAEITSSITTTSDTMVDVTGMSITIPAGITRPIMLHAEFPTVYNSLAAGGLLCAIADNSGTEIIRGRFISSGNNVIGQISLWRRMAAGTSGTYKVQWSRSSASGTANMTAVPGPTAGATVPFLRAITV